MAIDYDGGLHNTDRSARALRKARKVAEQKRMSLDQALQVLRDNNFKVLPPSAEEEMQMQEESKELLGIVVPKKPVEVKRTMTIKINLLGSHTINGIVYGPGLVTIPPLRKKQGRKQFQVRQDGLAGLLLEQDQRAALLEFDTLQNRRERSHIIVERYSGAGKACVKASLPDNFFASGMALENAPVLMSISKDNAQQLHNEFVSNMTRQGGRF